jgi:hypothetical protein
VQKRVGVEMGRQYKDHGVRRNFLLFYPVDLLGCRLFKQWLITSANEPRRTILVTRMFASRRPAGSHELFQKLAQLITREGFLQKRHSDVTF